MSQQHPTHDELVTEEMMMTQGLHDDETWCNVVHHSLFGTEGQPHVFVLWRNEVNSYSGPPRTFVNVFQSVDAATGYVIATESYWQKNPNAPLEPYFTIEERAVLK